MDTSDVLKLVLGVVAVLLLGRLFLGALFATAMVGAHGPMAGSVVLLPVVLVAGGLLALAVAGVAYGVGGEESDDALDELRKAYARGDIDDEEFERRRERLTGSQR
ncbi:MAG: SHOCT domain-containing protein [Halobacteriaceae archaeon]